MKYTVNITRFTLVNQIEDYWTTEDYIELLKGFDFTDTDSVEQEELKELLLLAISDFEPDEAATILLNYKLSDQLSKGQIDQLSHEMMEDKVSEEYPEISLHATLFHINQLLYKAYNGKFPNVKASIIEFEMRPLNGKEVPVTPEMVLKVFKYGFSDSSVVGRLFEDQLNGAVDFPEAESIIWELKSLEKAKFRLISSEYWLNREDFSMLEFEGKIMEYVAEHDG